MTTSLPPLTGVSGDVAAPDVTTDPARDAVAELELARAEIAELREALRTNREIGAAIGIVMERFDLDADAALGYLKRLSSQHNRKLRDVAATLVETGQLPEV